ncbi:hypothetical protein Q0590_29050 [Rhodocytophaga aerolata]|uniref:Insertion element IS150 protein InsJ-like helix-turn-helix domain-containing protein n=1 Tax=Rhodocytophaga aerolata TaxID=455078 RepID=A0ABT8RE27_9BACT|nr:hypothetical protein [Rhodocytophaga aerolata]MDO1450359.1 hypothetical protein [Rhodocytophaga aerolata]
MYVNYQELISQSVEELRQLEQKQKEVVLLKRLQVLRLLKSGQAKNMEEAATLVGISAVQARRLWREYKRFGLDIALICLKPGKNSRLKLTSAALHIEARVTSGYFRSLKQVQEFLLKKYQVGYTQAGVWHLLKTLNLELMPKKARRGYKAKGKQLK